MKTYIVSTLLNSFYCSISACGIPGVRMRDVAIILCLMFPVFEISAQTPGLIKGKIIDSLSATPVSFATIRIFSNSDKKLINGDISREGGDFSMEVQYGEYYAEIDFMGYESKKSPAFTLTEQKPTYDFGVVKLTTSVSTLDEIVVQA